MLTTGRRVGLDAMDPPRLVKESIRFFPRPKSWTMVRHSRYHLASNNRKPRRDASARLSPLAVSLLSRPTLQIAQTIYPAKPPPSLRTSFPITKHTRPTTNHQTTTTSSPPQQQQQQQQQCPAKPTPSPRPRSPSSRPCAPPPPPTRSTRKLSPTTAGTRWRRPHRGSERRGAEGGGRGGRARRGGSRVGMGSLLALERMVRVSRGRSAGVTVGRDGESVWVLLVR